MGQFSQCEGCKVIGTHSGDLECGCGEYDFLYTFNKTTEQSENFGEAKCSECTMKLFEEMKTQ